MASWPGKSLSATLWLMMTTRSDPSLSVSRKSRPSTKGTPRVEKNPGETERNLGAQIFVAVLARGAFDGEGEADAQALGVAPGNGEAGGDAFHARQRRDAADDFVVEVLLLLRRAAVGDGREIDREHVRSIERWARGFEVVESAQEESGAGEEQERRGDLRDSEDAQAAVGAGGAAGSANGEAGGGRGLRRRQARDVREED